MISLSQEGEFIKFWDRNLLQVSAIPLPMLNTENDYE